jgi:hypothetical protein
MNEEPDIIVSDEDWGKYFFHVRLNKPKKGQIIARYTAMADMIEGFEKKNIINMLKNTDQVVPVTQAMTRCLNATELESYRVPRRMVQDMIDGMTEEQVYQKPYRYQMEMLYYAFPEHIPQNDPHWSAVSISNLEDAIAMRDPRIESKILFEE